MIHSRPDYNRIQDPKLIIPDDEPVFLLRATDITAPHIVRLWASVAKNAGADESIVNLARAHADRMEEWQKANGCHIPDLPVKE